MALEPSRGEVPIAMTRDINTKRPIEYDNLKTIFDDNDVIILRLCLAIAKLEFRSRNGAR